MSNSSPHESVKQRPSQHETRQTSEDAARPELKLRPVVATRVKRAEPGLERRGRHAEAVEEDRGQQREDQVEEKAAVGLEAQDAGCDSEQRGCEGLEIHQGLHEWKR